MAHAPVATYERVYVWEFPVRFYHWTNAICVVVLIATGFLIGHPVSIFYASEAYQQYWFGTVRFAHFTAAFIFFFVFLTRIYWGFVGNVYAQWRNFIPLHGGQFREMGDIVKVDVLQTKIKGDISIGHNALAGFMALTGRRSGMFRRDDVAELSRRYVAECLAVAQAEVRPALAGVGGLVDAVADG